MEYIKIIFGAILGIILSLVEFSINYFILKYIGVII